VKLAIEEILAQLPQMYSSDLYERKCQAVYQHVYAKKFNQG
jgi:type I restriction enzyme R subunit